MSSRARVPFAVPSPLAAPLAVGAALLASAAVALAVAAAGARAAVARTARACPGANLAPTPSDLGRVDAATLCLINSVRIQNGLAPLRNNARLDRAAGVHSRDMTGRGYFAHTGPGGDSLVARLVAVGFLHPGDNYLVGENIGWGVADNATPAAEVAHWLGSPEHRANILAPQYRFSGIGVSAAVPAGQPGATYTEDFSA